MRGTRRLEQLGQLSLVLGGLLRSTYYYYIRVLCTLGVCSSSSRTDASDACTPLFLPLVLSSLLLDYCESILQWTKTSVSVR